MSASEAAALITAIAALITAFGMYRRARAETASLRQQVARQAVTVGVVATDTAAVRAELTPNHGSSVKDQLALVLDLVRSQGHQLGEIRDDARAIHEDHAARIRALERHCHSR